MYTVYKHRIVGRKNFSDIVKWVSGADSLRAINVIGDTKSDQHVRDEQLINGRTKA